MRSFIKAHRRSGSIDRNKPANTESAGRPQTDHDTAQNNHKQLHARSSSDVIPGPPVHFQENPELLEFAPSTPFRSHTSQGHTSPTRSSPSFESFHKLASRTKFTSKLFNKNSSSTSLSHLPSQEHIPSNTPHSTSSSPIKLPQPHFGETPAIKGTITHSWGRSKTPSHIINLNNSTREQEKPGDRRFSTDSWEPSFGTTSQYHLREDQIDHGASPSLGSDSAAKSEVSEISTIHELYPAFKAQVLHDPDSREEIMTRSPPSISSLPNLTKEANHNEDKARQDTSTRRHSLATTKNKVKNRKITIHSSGDLLNLQKQSTDPNPPIVSSSPIPKIRIEQSTPSKTFANNNSDIEEENSNLSNEVKHLSFDSDSDSDESKFSFEYSNINGRTSSMKYYRKPDENTEEGDDENQHNADVYIDDLYEDEDFDEDMNYCDSGFTHSEDSYVREPEQHFVQQKNKPEKEVKKYGDIFDLSDEEDGVEINNANDDNDQTEQDLLNQMNDTSGESGYNDIAACNKTESNKSPINSKPRSNITNISNIPPKKTTISKYDDLFDISDDDLTEESIEKGNDEGEIAARTPSTVDEDNKNWTSNSTPKTHSKPIKRYNDLFDLSDEESDNLQSFPDDQNLNAYYNEPGELEVGMKMITLHGNRGDSKLPFLGNRNTMHDNINLTTLPEKLQTNTFNSPLTNESINGMSPLKHLTPRVLLSPADSDNQTDLSVELKTPKEHLLMLSPQGTGNFENSPSQSNLPPPARSQSLKYHDLNSNLDSEIPGMTSNLFFIDEAEEDEYNQRRKPHSGSPTRRNGVKEDEDYSDYLDEINTVPEDFEFSDNDDYQLDSYVGRRHARGYQPNQKRSLLESSNSFRKTHSFHNKPLGVSRESTPQNNKLELQNKTVTFFSAVSETPETNHSTSRESSLKRKDGSPLKEDMCDNGKTQEFFVPSPAFARGNTYSLSPIQESAATNSAPSSPKVA